MKKLTEIYQTIIQQPNALKNYQDIVQNKPINRNVYDLSLKCYATYDFVKDTVNGVACVKSIHNNLVLVSTLKIAVDDFNVIKAQGGIGRNSVKEFIRRYETMEKYYEGKHVSDKLKVVMQQLKVIVDKLKEVEVE